MERRGLLKIVGTAAALLLGPRRLVGLEAPASPFHVKPFELEEATLEALQTAMTGRKETAVSLTRKYLRRIEELDHRGPALHAIIETNPDATVLVGLTEDLSS